MPQSEIEGSRTSAVIAGRMRAGDLEICLIRNKDSGKWGVPKGIVDPGDTPEETALNEAWEEAGLNGELLGGPIGNYVHRKWGTSFTVSVYLMKVISVEDSWDEMDFRDRRWVKAEEALSLLRNHRVYPLLGRGLKLIRQHLA